MAKDALTSIKLAKRALHVSEQQHNRAIIIKSLNFISGTYWDLRQYDSAKIYANNALMIAEKYQIDSLKGDSWMNLGMCDYQMGAFKQSISEYQKAALIYRKTKKQSALATSFLNIGICERKLSKYLTAIDYFIKSSAIFENLQDKESLSYTYNSIAICFNELNNSQKTLEYNKKALAIRQNLNDKKLISQSLNNIGFAFKKYKQPDSAIYYLSRSFAIRRLEKDSSSMVLTLQNMGSAWTMKGDLRKAVRYVVRAQNIAKQYEMSEELARGNADLAEIYIKQKKYSPALTAINFTIDTAQKLKISELLLEAYNIKYNLYNQSGDYKNAVLYLNKKSDLKDTLFTAQKNRAIDELEIQYQTKQREKDITDLSLRNNLQEKVVKQQKLSITILIISAILLLVLFGITYNNFRAKQKANLRIQTLMRDLHHRVKNNLQILSGLFSMQIENLSDENTKNALRENEARLTSMNLIHNKLYLNNTTTKIEMGDYLTNLLNHIRDSFGSEKQSLIDLRIEVSNIMLEADKAVAIGLIANELATNAFKYAFNDQGGEIYLALKFVEKSKLLLTLCDNGIGFDEEKNKNRPPSFGLRLVNLMARQLNSTLVVTTNPGVSYQMEISV